jgi:hypothetical protein
LEHTPRDTLQDIAKEKSLEVLSKEWDEDKGDHHGQRGHHGVSVANLVDNDSSSVQAKNFTNESTIGETCLPEFGS